MTSGFLKIVGAALLSLLVVQTTLANNKIDHQSITLWSQGARLQGDIFKPAGLAVETKLPGILLIHGWGGEKSHLNKAYAPQFAGLGFIVMTFDFRSWGESDGFLLADAALPRVNETAAVTVRGQQFRHIVNPLKMVEDARAALSYLVGEAQVQPDNIGLWGTSLGGGIALVTAANDNRVKALVSQIGAVNNKANFAMVSDREVAQWETLRARGEIAPYPGPESGTPGLKGYPDLIAMKHYDPAAWWDKLAIPTLIIDAEDEELFDRTLNGKALHKNLQGRVDTKYLTLPGQHYAIYRDQGYAKALQAAQQWFVTYLRGEH